MQCKDFEKMSKTRKCVYGSNETSIFETNTEMDFRFFFFLKKLIFSTLNLMSIRGRVSRMYLLG